MPQFMDVHTSMVGVTTEALAAGCTRTRTSTSRRRRPSSSTRRGPTRGPGHVFCLSDGPSAEAVQRIHERAGHPADRSTRSR